MEEYVVPQDLIDRWRPLTQEEIELANTLLEDASAALTIYASDRGYNLYEMVTPASELDPDLKTKLARARLLKAVLCDIVRREMESLTDSGPAMSQFSQAAGGYSVSGTFLSPGGGLFIKNAELKMLGLTRQKIKAVKMYADD